MELLDQYQKFYEKAVGKKEHIQNELEAAQSQLAASQSEMSSLEKALAYIQVKAQETQNQLSFRVEDIVQMAIDTCFSEDAFKFQLLFESKRGRTEASLGLLQEGTLIDPLLASGGGLADLVAFGLRISAWTLNQNNNVIVMDEPFRFLSENLRPLAGEILKELSQRLGVQFIIVTHDTHIVEVADKVIVVGKKNGKSITKILKQ